MMVVEDENESRTTGHASPAYCVYMVSNSHRQEQIELIKSKQMCRKQAANSNQITIRREYVVYERAHTHRYE